MNDKDNFELDSELAKSIEKLIDEETTVAKAYVDRNLLKHSDYDINKKSIYDEEKSKTQAIPEIPSRKVALGNITKDVIPPTSPSPNKKKLDKKAKLIIAGVSAAVILVIIAIIIVSLILNNKNKSSYNYNYSKGVGYYNDKDFKSALPYFEKAEAADTSKKNIDLKFKLYDCYIGVADNDKAIEKLKEILSYEKNNEMALTALASNYASNKQGDKLTALIRSYKGADGLKYLTSYVVPVPTFSKAAGKFDVELSLELVTTDTNKIYYTLDGTDPTTKSLLYAEALSIKKGDTTVKAIAVNAVGTASDIVEQKYTVDFKAPEAPDISPVTGTYQEGQKIEVTNIKSGDTAYYTVTVDGTDPTKDSTPYTGPFVLPAGNNIVKVIIINQYNLSSSITSKNYTVVASRTYTYDEALELLKARMRVKGDLKADGKTSSDGKAVTFVFNTKKIVNNIDMWIVFCDIASVRQNYGVAVKSGQCYKVTENAGVYSAAEY